ncbi:MAG: hypothetical protein WA323_22390 [Candidatus Nitrosopolaris sp.]|jgi:hypothetical protein
MILNSILARRYLFISKNLLEIAFLVQNIRPFNQDLIRKQMLFGIGSDFKTITYVKFKNCEGGL